MPHRRGSFHEDVAAILKRVAQPGAPDVPANRRDGKAPKAKRKRQAIDFHQKLFDGSRD
jgi:hypothetical protein